MANAETGGFVDLVNELSGGRIKIALHAGEELVPNDEMYDAVQRGTLELCYNAPAYYEDKLPVAGVENGMPFAWTSTDQVLGFWYYADMDNVLRDAYAEQGLAWLGFVPTSAYTMVTNKPVKSLADLKKLNIRAYGTFADMLTRAGISTVYIPFTEVYVAMSRKTVDGALMADPAEYYDMKFQEVATQFVMPPFLEPYMNNIFMNLDVFNSITPEDQAILRTAVEAYRLPVREWYLSQGKQALKAMSDLGVQVVTLPPEDVNTLVQAAFQIWDERATEDPLRAQMTEKLKEWRTILASGGRTTVRLQ
jgi:TRAP-type C4-dicarboxylate transport system substrate-binding protein